jgi:hypothetical protein
VNPNAALSVRDVKRLLHALEKDLRSLDGIAGQKTATQRRHMYRLMEKLRQVRWS